MSVHKKVDAEDAALVVFSVLFALGVLGMIVGAFLPFDGYNWGLRILLGSGITAVISAFICLGLSA